MSDERRRDIPRLAAMGSGGSGSSDIASPGSTGSSGSSGIGSLPPGAQLLWTPDHPERSVGHGDITMEINNYHRLLSQKDVPPPLYVQPGAGLGALSEVELQAQLMGIQNSYQRQHDALTQQFDEQRRMLAVEQEAKVQEYLKMMMLQKQQEILQHQQKMVEEHSRQKERIEKEKLDIIKHKKKGDESAIASSEVKQRLRECLLSKGTRDIQLKNSPPEFRQWATQHSSLEQHSPPTSNLSPPLHAAHLLGRYDEEYPLRKTVSEPNLKMRSSMRQKVMPRNSPLMHRHDLFKKKHPLTTSEPNLKVRLALKQKMMERRSSPLLRRKERYGLGSSKRNTTPLTIDTTLCNSNPDSGPNSPPGSSHGSGEMPILDKPECPASLGTGSSALPLQLMSKMVNQSLPNISIGQPRDKAGRTESPVGAGLSLSASEAELRARMVAQYGMPPILTAVPEGEMSPTNTSLVEAQMKALELARSVGQIPNLGPRALSPYALYSNLPLQEVSAATQARLQRPLLMRTQSAPQPLTAPAMWNQQQLLLQKHHELMQKDQQKMLLKQKLQSTLLQRSSSKNQMENVDEAAEARLLQARGDVNGQRDVVVIDDRDDGAFHPQRDVRRETQLMKMHKQSATLGSCSPTSAIPERLFERTQSTPIMGIAASSADPHIPRPHQPTALAYDSLMMKHQCLCGNPRGHPENPERTSSIWHRLQEAGLVTRCEKIKSRKATPEELGTCHSKPYVHMYGSNPHKLDPHVYEMFLPRFVKLQCGGVGVDSDTVWNEHYSPQAARLAAGCTIDLAFKVARREQENGFAIVRPPGHHAEDTQAMGFCFFNNIAIATKLLLDRLQMKRIIIIDWDVHHGNSTQQLFYTDPRVLYISLHRHDNGNFFPGTGAPEDCGIAGGVGFNVNIAWSGDLNPPMGDAEYMAAFRTIVMPIAREFAPEMVLVSAGFDAASGHPAPLGGYMVSPACFGHMTKQLQTLAEGRMVLVLEGGYELQSMCDSAEYCLRALLGEEMPPLKPDEVLRPPCKVAMATLENTIKCQARYWPCVAGSSTGLHLSAAEAMQLERREADTATATATATDTAAAFASLSMVTEPTPRQEDTTLAGAEGETDTASEPMEES